MLTGLDNAPAEAAGLLPRRFLQGRALAALIVIVTVASRAWAADGEFAIGYALTLVGWLASSTAAASLVHRFGPRGRIVLGGVVCCDSLAAAVAVRAAGGIQGPAVLLFMLPVLEGVLVLRRPWILWHTALTALLYALLGYESLSERAEPVLGSTILFHTLLFTAFGVAAGLAGSRIARVLKEAASSRSELEAFRLSADRILEMLSCGLFAVDAGGRILFCNPEAALLAEPDERDDIDDAWTLLESQNGSLLALVETHLRNGQNSCERELVMRRGAGERFPAWVKIASLTGRAGEFCGLAVLTWDLTERKRIEEAGRRRERMATIGELSAGLAHEIRNSLKPITGCIELLLKQDRLSGESAPIAELIARESDALEAFLSQFLMLTRNKALKLEEIDLEKLIQDEVRAMRLGGPGSVTDIRVTSEGLGLRADREWLRQAVRNVLLNAYEARPSGRVTVEVDEFERNGAAWVRVAVTDEGPGLREIRPSEAFEPFRTTKPNGSGLGLSIVQRAVHEHGGRVGFDPSCGHGARVILELPCRRAYCATPVPCTG